MGQQLGAHKYNDPVTGPWGDSLNQGDRKTASIHAVSSFYYVIGHLHEIRINRGICSYPASTMHWICCSLFFRAALQVSNNTNTHICFFPIKKQVFFRWIWAYFFPSVHWKGRALALAPSPRGTEVTDGGWPSPLAEHRCTDTLGSFSSISHQQLWYTTGGLDGPLSHPPQMLLCDHPPACSQQKHIKIGKVLRLTNIHFYRTRSHLLERNSISKLHTTVYFQVLMSL